MVRTMFNAFQERDPGFQAFSTGGSSYGEGEQEVGWGEGAVVPRAGPGDAIENAAGSCVLWCTVAVGCLVGGRPLSSVSSAISASVCSALFQKAVADVAMFAERGREYICVILGRALMGRWLHSPETKRKAAAWLSRGVPLLASRRN